MAVSLKESVERGVYKVKEAGQKKVAGERSVSVGSLITFLIGAALIGYGAWKLSGKNKSYAVVGGLVLIFAGDLVF